MVAGMVVFGDSVVLVVVVVVVGGGIVAVGCWPLAVFGCDDYLFMLTSPLGRLHRSDNGGVSLLAKDAEGAAMLLIPTRC